MTLVRWDPYWNRAPLSGLNAVQRQVNRIFDEFFNREESEAPATWMPRVDFIESGDKFELTVELPGLDKDDVKLEMQNDILTISGEKQQTTDKKERNLYLCERVYGSFRRSFQFTSQVEAAKIDAQFRNGLLVVTVPKAEVAKPKQIDIKVH